MKRISKFRSLFTGAAVTSVSALFAVGCLNSSTKGSLLSLSKTQSQAQPPSTDTGSGGGTGGGTVGGSFQVVPAGASFSITGAMAAAINLGGKTDQAYTLHTGNYSGSIQLSVENDEIKAIDPKSQIAVTINPSTINVAPNSNYNFTVHVEATQAAPDFALHYHVLAREASGSLRKETKLDTEFAVNPIFEIFINAGNALNTVLWSTDLIDPGTGVAKKQDVAFSSHVGGVTVRFINMDPKGPHIVHGAGLIPHQNTGTRLRSLATGAVNPPGQTYIDAYEVKVTSTAANGSGGYYLHDAESSAKSGKISFNIDGTAVKPPVVDPTATYTKMFTTILQPKCVGCHSTANPMGAVDLSTFAKVSGSVVPFNAASSSLYTSVLSNMSLGGTPLTPTEKDLIKNWINNGALNN